VPKNVRREELPEEIDVKWFRYTFVTTYMAYMARLMNPWDVPAKLACENMQLIWDKTGGPSYKVTVSSTAYQKVCGGFVLDHNPNLHM
jgi:hypothetical protein